MLFLDVVGFSDESTMVQNFMQTLESADNAKQVLAGVVFTKMPGVLARTSEPVIEYKIRFPSNLRSGSRRTFASPFGVSNHWMTQFMFPVFQKVGPRSGKSTQGGPPGSRIFAVFFHAVSKISINYY